MLTSAQLLLLLPLPPMLLLLLLLLSLPQTRTVLRRGARPLVTFFQLRRA